MSFAFDEKKAYAVIAPDEFRRYFLGLKEKKPSLDIAFYTKEEAIRLFGLRSDLRALSHLIDKGFSYSFSKELLEAFCAPFFEKTKSEELKGYAPVREELIRLGYLRRVAYPERSFANREVFILAYNSTKRLSEFLGNCSPNMSIGYLPYPIGKREGKIAYREYRDFYEEIHALLNAIAHEIDSGTSPEDIYVFGLSDPSYSDLLKRASEFYGFSFDIDDSIRIHDHPAYWAFRKRYMEGDDPIAIRDNLLKEYPDADTAPILEEVYALLKPDRPLEERLSLLDFIAKAHRFKTDAYKGAVHLSSSFYLPPGKVGFGASFISGVYPSSPRDTGFLTSSERSEIGLLSADEKSLDEWEAARDLISSPGLRWLSLSKAAFGNTHWISGLAESEKLERDESLDVPYEYSSGRGYCYLSYLLDEGRRRSERSPFIAPYKDIQDGGCLSSYRSYVYKGYKLDCRLPKITARENDTYYISYSAYDEFAKCPFRYLMTRWLGISSVDDDFHKNLGDIFHHVREKAVKENRTDHDALYEEAFEEVTQGLGRPLTPREIFLFKRMLPYSRDSFSFEKDREAHLPPDLEKRAEGAFTIKLDDRLALRGRYDHINHFTFENESYIEIIDYKTGSSGFFDKVAFDYFGLSAQLPFYLLYAQKGKDFEFDHVGGAFISPLIGKVIPEAAGQNAEFKKKDFLMVGMPYASIFYWNKIGADYIKGLKIIVNKESKEPVKFHALSKTYSDQEMRIISDKAQGYLFDMRDNLDQGAFDISPKRVKIGGTEIDACDRCPARDICFRPEWAFPTKYYSKDGKVADPSDTEDDEEGGADE